MITHPARPLAVEALRAALGGHWPLVAVAVEAIRDEHGPGGLRYAVAAWCDTCISLTPGLRHGDAVGLEFEHREAGSMHGADEVPADVRWSGQVLAARAAMDRATFGALMDALPDDPDVVRDRMISHLQVTVDYLRDTAATIGR